MIEAFSPTVVLLWLGVFLPLLLAFVWTGRSLWRNWQRRPLGRGRRHRAVSARAACASMPTPEERLEVVRRIFAANQPLSEDDPYRLGRQAHRLCWPQLPVLADAVRAALGQHDAPIWQLAELDFDALIVEFEPCGELQYPNLAAILDRLRQGIVAHDDDLWDYAAHYAADMMDRGRLDDDYSKLVFAGALDWTANLHWPRPAGHDRLLTKLASDATK